MDLIAWKENGLKLTSLKLIITECRYIPGENGYICSTNCSVNLCPFGLHEAKVIIIIILMQQPQNLILLCYNIITDCIHDM